MDTTEQIGLLLHYEDLEYLLELTRKKDLLFIIGDLNAKEGRQGIPRITGKFDLGVQNEARQRLTVEHTGQRKYPFPTTYEMTIHMDITRWSIPKSE